MAAIKAIKNGVWNDPTVWSTGTIPTFGDTVYNNTFVIQISSDVNLIYSGTTIPVSSINPGEKVSVVSIGTTNFATIGGENTVSYTFTTTGSATGTGTVIPVGTITNDFFNSTTFSANALSTSRFIIDTRNNQINLSALLCGGTRYTSNVLASAVGTNILNITGNIEFCRPAANNGNWVNNTVLILDNTGLTTLSGNIDSLGCSPNAIISGYTGLIKTNRVSNDLHIYGNIRAQRGTDLPSMVPALPGFTGNKGFVNSARSNTTHIYGNLQNTDYYRDNYTVENINTGDIIFYGDLTSGTGGYSNICVVNRSGPCYFRFFKGLRGGSAGNGASCVWNGGTLSIYISGVSLIAGTGSPGAAIENTGILNLTAVNCTLETGSNSSYGISLYSSSGTMNLWLTGDVISNNIASANIYTVGGNISILGNVYANSNTNGITHTGTSNTIFIDGDVYAGNYSNGISSSINNVVIYTGNLFPGPLGDAPIYASTMRFVPRNNRVIGVNTKLKSAPEQITPGTVYYVTQDMLSGLTVPPITAVRAGVMYSNLTGTCAIPQPSSVMFGVPVDTTTGTAVLRIEDFNTFFNTPLSALTTPQTLGTTLKDAITVDAAGHLISSFTNG